MNKNWFTLIEVIIATGILTISVFWVYKLISENNKILEKSNNSLSVALLFPVLENCIENKEVTVTWYYNLWTDLDKCNFSFNESQTIIDWITYTIYSENINENVNSITWQNSISSDYSWTNTWTYIQKK